jgi:hypothetical protein
MPVICAAHGVTDRQRDHTDRQVAPLIKDFRDARAGSDDRLQIFAR